jgi:hypothetical protein
MLPLFRLLDFSEPSPISVQNCCDSHIILDIQCNALGGFILKETTGKNKSHIWLGEKVVPSMLASPSMIFLYEQHKVHRLATRNHFKEGKNMTRCIYVL